MHGRFSRIENIGTHKRLNKLKKIKTVLNTFSDHNGMQLEINYMKKKQKPKQQTSKKSMDK